MLSVYPLQYRKEPYLSVIHTRNLRVEVSKCSAPGWIASLLASLETSSSMHQGMHVSILQGLLHNAPQTSVLI